MYKKIQKIHFVGIGGIGMSGIAEVLINLGYIVMGSDIKKTDTTERLTKLGAAISYGHKAEHLKDCDVVVISSAVKQDNPEVKAAHQRMIPVIPRAEMLAELMRMKYGVAVAGTHGKTTTTSLIATVLAHAGLDPTVVIGGKLNSLGTNAKLGQGEFMVVEADESDGSFLKLSPTIAVVTNIDPEHLDYYKDMNAVKKAFVEFVNKIPFYGQASLCLDEENVQGLIPYLKKRHVTYGLASQADFQARDLKFRGLESRFDAYYKNQRLGPIRIKLPGQHNVYNSLAAISVGLELDAKFDIIESALNSFSGIQRRFQIKGEPNSIMVVDDYGHHPEEIKATLKAAKDGWNRRVVVAFQPHRYSRTRDIFNDFLTAFYQADILLITEIYPAGEESIPGITAEKLFEGIKDRGHKDVHYFKSKQDITEYSLRILKQNDIFITLGAGDIWQVGDEVLKKLI